MSEAEKYLTPEVILIFFLPIIFILIINIYINIDGNWNTFVETIRDFDNEIIGYKLFANETKLSNLSPLTNNQKVFQKMLKESKLEFSIRSKDPAITKGILEQGARVNIEKWIQTTGKGVEKATDITTKSLF